MNLIYDIGEVYWMTGVIVVGLIFGAFAMAYSKDGKK